MSVSANISVINTGFLDTGGTADYAAYNLCSTDIQNRKIYLRDTIFWKVSEKDRVTFASIRNDIAILHKQLNLYFSGCETNNYGRSEMESLRRDYGIKMYGVNTVGKITSNEIIKKGESMDKTAIIKFTNSWRQNAQDDPANKLKLGQIVLTKQKTPAMIKWMNQLDSFVRVDPEGIGSTGAPKFGALGNGHDDGIMASLGNIFLIKTKIFKIFSGNSSVGAVMRNSPSPLDPSFEASKTKTQLTDRAMGRVDDSYLYEDL